MNPPPLPIVLPIYFDDDFDAEEKKDYAVYFLSEC